MHTFASRSETRLARLCVAGEGGCLDGVGVTEGIHGTCRGSAGGEMKTAIRESHAMRLSSGTRSK